MFTYRVKIRKRTYLWGSAEAEHEAQLPLFLLFRVDDTGEKIKFGKSRLDGGGVSDVPLGSLKPGESFAVALKGLVGVYADCGEQDTFATCMVLVKQAD